MHIPSSFYCNGHHRDLHSFPTRRSSDLKRQPAGGGGLPHRVGHRQRVAGTGDSRVEEHAVAAQLHGEAHIAGSSHARVDRKSTRLNSSHTVISYAVFCMKKKKSTENKKE